MDDAALVHRAREGDKEAFASIYDGYAGPLHAFLTSVLRDEHEASDVLHDTFLVAGARLGQLRDPTRLRAWLFAIARHRAYRLLEGRRRVDTLEGVEVSAPEPAVDEVADRGELAELVRAAAEGLSPRDQVILNLHLHGGLEGQDLGDAIGVSADHAYVLLSRLRDQVERSLGALLVARQGRADCPDLARLLAGWDGRFSTVWRKRVARHADECETCGDLRRRTLRPAALLGVSPALALPAGLRERVLGDVELVSHRGRPWPARHGGFPPPLVKSRRRPLAAVSAAAVLVLLLGTAVLLLPQDDDTSQVTAVAAGDTTSIVLTPVPTGGPEPGIPASAPPTEVVPTTGVTTATTAAPPVPPTTAPPTTAPPTTGTTTPGDTAPPTISGFRVNPATVRAGPRCTNTVDPTTATVLVVATDPSGIASVTLIVDGPGPRSLPMTDMGGDRWTLVLGPFPNDALAPGARLAVPLTARVVDTAGNQATANAQLTLRCDAPPAR